MENVTMLKQPKISVVMSAYNREKMVKEAIESILNQTYTDFEFIIIDDCSKDNTAKVIQAYADKDERIVFIKNKKNMHYNYNLRKGFEIANGEYIARMDDDDIAMPTKFEKQVEFLDKNPKVTVLGTFIAPFGSESVSWVTETDSDKLNVLMNFFNPMCHPSVMIRKSFLDEHNLTYSPEALYAEEYDLWKNILLKGGKLANLQEILLKYRTHNKRVSEASSTVKTQQQTAYNVRLELLSRFFTDIKECKSVINQTIHYPFTKNKKASVYSTLKEIKNRNNGELSNVAIEEVIKDYCGSFCEEQKEIEPAFNENNIPIIFASDNNYVPYLGVTIKSIIENASDVNNYDIIVLESSISQYSKQVLQLLKENKKNISIRFFNVSDFLNKRKFFTSRYLTIETYFRLFIPEIFKNYEKLIYLDCDIIILDDIAKFYETDINDYLIGATHNLASLYAVLYNCNVFDRPFTDYCKNVLKMTNPIDYFQAGVLLFNVKKMREQNIQEKALKMVSSGYDFIMHDQDILNSLCSNQVKLLSQEWDLFNCYSEEDHSIQVINHFPKHIKEDYLNAKKNPKLIHYAGTYKVWQHPEVEYAHHWWKYARMTPFYEQIMYQNIKPTSYGNEISPSKSPFYNVFLVLELIKYELLYKATTGKLKKKYKIESRGIKAKIIQNRVV